MTDLFSETQDFQPELDQTKEYFKELVGEGKKFSDPEALARGKAESDQFIERLKQEQAGLRQELNSRVKMEEFLDKLNTFQQPKSPNVEQQPPDQTKGKTELTPADVLQLLDQRDQKSKADANTSKVIAKLQENFGPNYANKLKQVAQDLSLAPNHLNNLAATSPEAFYKLVGVEEKKQDLFQSPPRTQMSTGFQPKGNGKDWDYFQNIKKESPTKYWSAAVQNEMHTLRAKGLLNTPYDTQ